MSNKKIVHVVGTGTIGEPLIGILCEQKSNLGIDEVTFHKQSPLTKDAPKIKNLIAKGARLAVHEDRVESFKEIGLEPEFTMEEAVSRSSVVIDCTPKGFGHKNKVAFYVKYADKVKGFAMFLNLSVPSSATALAKACRFSKFESCEATLPIVVA